MKKIIYLFVFLIIVFFISCTSLPEQKGNEPTPVVPTEPVKEVVIEQVQEPKVEEPKVEAPKVEEPVTPESKNSDEEIIAEFDGVAITKKDKKVAKSEIEEVVKKLNQITEKKDYSLWLLYLSSAYKEEYSKPEVLKKTSESLPGIAKGIKLKNLNDYFSYVFVPSRQQMRVDDIKYLSPSKVQVLKKNRSGTLILYNLEKINGKWLLVP